MIGPAIRERRERFGMSVEDVAALAGLDVERTRAAESADDLSWSVLAALARALAFDPSALVRGEPLTDPRRMPGWFRSHQSDMQREAIAPKDARLFARAAELGRMGGYLLELLDRGAPSFEAQRKSEQIGAHPPWQEGYQLGALDRGQLVPGPTAPLPCVRALLEKLDIHVALVEFETLEKNAVSLYRPGSMPIILLNIRAKRCRNRIARRAVLAHELCHLLHDTGEIDLSPHDGSTEPRLEALEQRANGYAPAFLAPPAAVIDDIQHRELGTPEAICSHIARTWGFTPEGAVWHAKNCRLIAPDVAEELIADVRWGHDAAEQIPMFEPDALRGDPAEHGLDTEVGNLVDGIIQDLALEAFDQSLITAGRAREILQFS